MLVRYGYEVCLHLHGEVQRSVQSSYRKPGAKRLRLGRQRRPFQEALERVKTHLEVNYIGKGERRVSAEAVSVELNLHIGCVKKAFMALNRAGFMSQAVHQENGRWCSEQDWIADVYTFFF